MSTLTSDIIIMSDVSVDIYSLRVLGRFLTRLCSACWKEVFIFLVLVHQHSHRS